MKKILKKKFHFFFIFYYYYYYTLLFIIQKLKNFKKTTIRHLKKPKI